MPPGSREQDTLRALRDLYGEEARGFSSAEVGSRSGLGDRATRRHLYDLLESGLVSRASSGVHPFVALWRPVGHRPDSVTEP